MFSHLSQLLAQNAGCTLPTIEHKVFKRTEPTPYEGKAKFRASPDAEPVDMTGKPVIVVDEKPTTASMDTVRNVMAANLASTQLDRTSETAERWFLPGLFLCCAIFIGIIWAVLR